MARVPQYGVPQVEARNTPNVRIDDSGVRQFGQSVGQIAQGVRDLGQVANQYAQQEQERADTAQLMEAQRKLGEMELELFNDPEKGAFATQGKDAMGIHQQVLPEYDRRVGEITGALPGRLQTKFAEFTMRKREQSAERLMNHSLREGEKYVDANEMATIETIANTGLANAQDPKSVDQSVDELMVAIGARYDRLGAPEAAKRLAVRKGASGVYRGVVERLLADDPNAAQERLDATRDLMQATDVAALEEKLTPIFEDLEYAGVAESVLSGGTSVAVVPKQRGKPSQAVTNAIEAAAQKHGVPAQYLYALAEQESAFNPKAYNAEHGASGIMQYIPGTAADRGIDPFDVNQAIDAAAKDFATRMKAGGIDEAIMSHFAGPGGGNRGPKTERYLSEVKGRAARWAGEARPQQQAAPTTLGEALARVKDDPRASNPRWLKGAQASVTRAWTIKERDEADRDSHALESMRAAADAAPAGTPLSRVPGIDYGLAVRKGWVGTLESLIDAKARGTVVETNPVTYDRFKRLAVTNPAEFAKPQTRLAIMQASGELGTSHLADLLGDHAALNDPSKREAKIADGLTQAQRIDSGLRILGYDSLKGATKQQREAEFATAYLQRRTWWIQENGHKKPTPPDEDAILRQTVQAFITTRPEDNPSGQSVAGRQALAAERFSAKISPETRERARLRLLQRNGVEPSDREIVNYVAKARMQDTQ